MASFKTALVTGGASGLGESTVRKLHKHGYSVAILDRDEEKGKALQAQLKNTIYIPCDVSDVKQVEEAVKKTVAAFGSLHVAVNSAGIVTAGTIISKKGPLSTDILHKVLQVNVAGTFNIAKFAAQQMASQEPVDKQFGRGVIINVASIAGIEGQLGQTIYSASKGAVIGMTLPMARDLGRYQIRVNTVAPGVIKTPMAAALSEKVEKSIEAQVAWGRLGHPDEFADLVYGLINSSYVNGEVIRMDGGTRLGML